MKKLDFPEHFDLEASACHLDEPCYRVKIGTGEDLSQLMPFLNAVADVIQYEPGEEPVMILKIGGCRVALRSHEIAVGPVKDRKEGEKALSEVLDYLNETWARSHEIRPNFRPKRRANAMEIYKLLPGTNCRECGESACLAFAVKLALGRQSPGACPALSGDSGTMEKVQRLIG